MAKKKTVKTMELEAPVLKNVIIEDDPQDNERQALVRFDDANILKINYNLQSELGELTNTADGKSADFKLGEALSYIPTLTVKFIIENSLGNTEVLHLLRNTAHLINRSQSAEFQIDTTMESLDVPAGGTGEFTQDLILFRKTSNSDAHLGWTDWSNLSGYTAEYSDMVNCTKAASASSNINITDYTKDASITIKLSA